MFDIIPQWCNTQYNCTSHKAILHGIMSNCEDMLYNVVSCCMAAFGLYSGIQHDIVVSFVTIGCRVLSYIMLCEHGVYDDTLYRVAIWYHVMRWSAMLRCTKLDYAIQCNTLQYLTACHTPWHNVVIHGMHNVTTYFIMLFCARLYDIMSYPAILCHMRGQGACACRGNAERRRHNGRCAEWRVTGCKMVPGTNT